MARLVLKEILNKNKIIKNKNNVTEKQLDFIRDICATLGFSFSEVNKNLKNKKEASDWIKKYIVDFEREQYHPTDIISCIDDFWEWDCPIDPWGNN